MTFDDEFNSFDRAPESPAQHTDPEPILPPPVQMPQSAQSGSYYSPRSGSQDVDNRSAAQSGSYYSARSASSPYGGGTSNPPSGGYYNGLEEEKPKKQHSHTGLKLLGIFACLVFVSVGSVEGYKYFSQNEKLRAFFGHDTKTNPSEISEVEDSAVVDESSKGFVPSGVAEDWVTLASREGAMSIPDIVDKVMPASVGVSSLFVAQETSYSFFGFGEPQTYEREMNGTGTGIVMNEDGYIITNAHVIFDNESQYHCGEAKEVQVVLNEKCYEGETQFEAEVIGYDLEEDIAVLHINTDQKLVSAEFGSSDDLRVGELVIAIGNPLGFDLFGSVSTGIVSALDRELTVNENPMRLIQTDTSINAGNSGGPLINSYGQVIGINSSKLSNTYYGDASIEGLCFAIPMSHAKSVVNDLISFGYVRGKPQIGITTTNVTEAVSKAYGLPMGVYVNEVAEGGSADLAGIKKGDIIVAVNDETITDNDELNATKNKYKAGDMITVKVIRNGQEMEFTLVLQEKQQENQNATDESKPDKQPQEQR